ncbi:MAG: DUF1636 family protein [Roseobacter sp.]|jgi:predicted metal-binding protein
MTSAILHLCQTCRPEAAAEARASLQAALDAVGLPAEVRDQACMNACDRPVSLSLQANGYATYFFTNVDPVKDRSDIVATVRHYLNSPKGWIEDARPCGRLRFCLTGRVPPVSSEG